MAHPSSDNVEHQKPRINIYTVMLAISFLALALGCVLLYQELQPYGEFLKWWQTSGV